MKVNSFDPVDVEHWCGEVGGELTEKWSRMGVKMDACELDDGTVVGARDARGPLIDIEHPGMDGQIQMSIEHAQLGVGESEDESYMFFAETDGGTDGYVYYGYDKTL